MLDVGKTSVKLAVTEPDGRVLEARSHANRVIEGPPYPHADTEGAWTFVLNTLRELGARHRIECIVPVAHGACAALIDEQELVLPLLDYEHDISDVDAEYEREARDFEHTGSPRLPLGLNLGRQLFWLERHHGESFGRARHVLTHPQYWAFRLSGAARSELTSLGCHTDLWNPSQRCFSAFAEARGYARLFPELVPAWTRVGAVTPEVAQHTGLDARCRVLAGVHDSNASYFAHRAGTTDPLTVISTGTWTVILAGGRSLAGLDPDRDMLANVDAFGDPVACCRFMGGREFQAIAGDEGLSVEVDGARLNRLIGSGAMAHPSFATQGGPFQSSTGSFTPRDFPSHAAIAERATLATLYTALFTDHCLDLLGARGTLVVDGRFAKNRAWLGTLASLRAGDRVLASEDEGSSRGAAALAAWPRRLESEAARRCAPLDLPGLSDYRIAWRSALPEAGRSASSSL